MDERAAIEWVMKKWTHRIALSMDNNPPRLP